MTLIVPETDYRLTAAHDDRGFVRLCCPQCDYPLGEISGDRCPECGFGFTAAAIAEVEQFLIYHALLPLRRGTWLAAIGAVLSFAALAQFGVNGSWAPTIASPFFSTVFTIALIARQVWVSLPDYSAVGIAFRAFVSILVVFFVGCLPFGLLLLAMLYSAHSAATLISMPRMPDHLSVAWSSLGHRLTMWFLACWAILVLSVVLEIAGTRTVL